jgi:hypothetical protein
LASVPQYRDNQKLIRFFREILDVEDANWKDYLEMLLKLRRGSNPPEDISDKVSRLYHLFSEVAISTQDWAEIRQVKQTSRFQLLSNSKSTAILLSKKS